MTAKKYVLNSVVSVAGLFLLILGSRSQTPISNPVSSCPPAIEIVGNPLDLSEWVIPDSKLGNTSMLKDELLMAGKNKEFYYVLVGTPDQTTIHSKTSVTVRNVDGSGTYLGYGLVFHSKTTPLEQGYAFLIDTARQRYRVVHHAPNKELVTVPWKLSTNVAAGTRPNILEIVDKGLTTELYINCHLVETIKNTYAYKNGVVGLYVGNALNIGFKDLKLETVQ